MGKNLVSLNEVPKSNQIDLVVRDWIAERLEVANSMEERICIAVREYLCSQKVPIEVQDFGPEFMAAMEESGSRIIRWSVPDETFGIKLPTWRTPPAVSFGSTSLSKNIASATVFRRLAQELSSHRSLPSESP